MLYFLRLNFNSLDEVNAKMNNDRLVRLACYSTNVTMSIVGNLSPLLFLTFRSEYGISYSLLGLLVLINFVTQLTVDLIFSFFSHRFNIPLAVKITPLIGVFGLAVFAVSPWIFPAEPYIGLVIGTIIFSASSGFAEVLISPVIAALPSDNPERDMSKLHSVYAWGVVGMIIYSTFFLFVFGRENWQYLALSLIIVPLVAFLLFIRARLPKLETPEKVSGTLEYLRKKELWICVLAIFLGGASECTMAQWCSSYLEESFGIDKVWGDIFGAALFALTLGIGRTAYSKRGKNIERVLLLGGIGATLCYLVASLSPLPVIGLVACGMTGLCVSMLWPGSLIVASDKMPSGGVFIYAMMAAGGDLGASVAPQLVGVVTDAVAANDACISLASGLGMTAEQLAMKCGLLVGMIFAACGIIVYFRLWKTAKKRKTITQ